MDIYSKRKQPCRRIELFVFFIISWMFIRVLSMDVLRPPDWMPNDYGLDSALVEPARQFDISFAN